MFKTSTLSFQVGNAVDRLLGPYFLPPCLTGVVYNDILQNIVPDLLQDEDPQIRIHLWIMYDTVPHFFLQFRRPMYTKQFFSCIFMQIHLLQVWLYRFHSPCIKLGSDDTQYERPDPTLIQENHPSVYNIWPHIYTVNNYPSYPPVW